MLSAVPVALMTFRVFQRGCLCTPASTALLILIAPILSPLFLLQCPPLPLTLTLTMKLTLTLNLTLTVN